jgi:hypothetical protein
MPAVLPRRSRKLAAVLAVAGGALAIGGASSAEAKPIPCEWYDCNWTEEVKFPPIPPECRCPDIYKKFTDYTVLDESLVIRRSDLILQAGVGARLDAPQLELGGELAAGFGG